jgi:membrane protein
VLALWAWIVALLILLGGEIAPHTQAMVVDGRSPAEVESHHRARSPVRADARHVSG